jgi:hypothetical protein
VDPALEPDERVQLPPAGGRARRRSQEIAYSLATAIDVLDAVRDSGQVAPDRMANVVVASISSS